MRANITDRDYEILSAYIDGQLTSGEQQKLEVRLRAREELQVALDELRRTRMLLRQAPRRRAPRNFTLTPAMVGETKRRSAPSWNWFPVLGFTSALAALALVAVIVLQFSPAGRPASTIAMQPQAGQMEDAAPQMRVMEAPAEPGEEAADQQFKMAEEPEQPGAGIMAEPEAGAQEAAPAPEAAMQPAEPTLSMLEEPVASEPAAEEPAAEEQPAAEEPGVAAAVPETPQEGAREEPPSELAEAAPPVILWNGGFGSVDGRGGAGGGMGGGMEGGPIVLPKESVDALEAARELEDPAAAAADEQPAAPVIEPTQTAQPSEPIRGSGPILGVPSAGEGGQIVEREALLSEPDAVTAFAEPPAESPAAELESQPQPQPSDGMPAEEQMAQDVSDPAAEALTDEASGRVLDLSPAALLALQIGLAALAAGAGVAAYLVRRRRLR